MRARKYTKKIQLYQTRVVSDDFGDDGTAPFLIGGVWCKIVTKDKLMHSTDLGVTDTNDTVLILLRDRSDFKYNSLNMFFRFDGSDWTIQGAPINKDFQNREIQITLVRNDFKQANEINPL